MQIDQWCAKKCQEIPEHGRRSAANALNYTTPHPRSWGFKDLAPAVPSPFADTTHTSLASLPLPLPLPLLILILILIVLVPQP
jgi:hypothetical protein